VRRTVVIDVVGLTEALLGPATPRLTAFAARAALRHIVPALPAVTCTAQANYLTGVRPSEHGIVGNGWYDRALAEVHFWKQSNRLVTAPKIWDRLRAGCPEFTCAQLFWWFNMYSTADYSITPRPMYPADGRKVFDIYTWPPSIRCDIQRELGRFPFANFWGPAAGVDSLQGPAAAATRWIAASAKWLEVKYRPTLTLVYLPHLDYDLQRHGPRVSAELNPAIRPALAQIDAVAGDLLDFFAGRGVQVVLLSEYGLTNVSRPVHLNRVFRQHGWLTIKEELGLELLDPGASRVFAVADHQVAHVYLHDASLGHRVRAVLENTAGVGQVLGGAEKGAAGLDHARAGDLIAVADEDAWFTYYYWLDEGVAPDFARTVDIHRKPGYDPVELFLDPARRFMRCRILWRLLQKRLGFRCLMDVIPLEAALVKGSHGRRPRNQADWPVLLAGAANLLPPAPIESTDVSAALLQIIMDGASTSE
jgi:predicted AlkP superfamily pyrophosphatase or phosphodiesterase